MALEVLLGDILFLTDREQVGVVIEESDLLVLVLVALLTRQRRLASRGLQGLPNHSLLECLRA